MPVWKVNSYGYPNPFMQGPGAAATNARNGWEIYEKFLQQPSYQLVKDALFPGRARQTVESWKAAFEEFGLLYVPRGLDKVHITPGGRQLKDAWDAQDEREFAWVGLNLLLRYPLRGIPTRTQKVPDSDLLLYWCLLAALVELDGLWWSEITRPLCVVVHQRQADAAVQQIRGFRANFGGILTITDQTGGKKKGVYNALNQVMVHGSLNHMLFTRQKLDSPYLPGEENFWSLNPDYVDLVRLALGAPAVNLPAGCPQPARLMQRLPRAPTFDTEAKHFRYAGAVVPSRAAAQQQSGVKQVKYGGELNWLLVPGQGFVRTGAHGRFVNIAGPVQALCALAPDQRVIFKDVVEAAIDTQVTAQSYIVETKTLAGDRVEVRLRRARDLVDLDYLLTLFEEP